MDVVPCDISVAGRVLAAFPEKLKEKQRVPDNLTYLGEICKTVRMESRLWNVKAYIYTYIYILYNIDVLNYVCATIAKTHSFANSQSQHC